MKFNIFQVDAFTDTIFGGNPACVIPLDNWLDDSILLKIAKENAVPETAFFVKKESKFHLRWFTPDIEMDLCGHATLATAHVIKTELNFEKEAIVFESASGNLSVTIKDDLYTLKFPSRMPIEAELPPEIKDAINIQPKKVLKSRDYVLVYESEDDIKNIKINRAILDQINLNPGGVIFTALGNKSDFVSRFFTSQSEIFEDPVTGSAHCSLIPYWANELKKDKMLAYQISQRRGKLECEFKGDYVLMSGNAKTYLKGTIEI